jgi:pimeloyl-ACP methyl ester carboxylesterase
MAERFEVEVDGGSLAVYRFGTGAPLVLAVHGITGNSHSWIAVAEALAGEASLLAVDLRGRADSNGLPGPYGTGAYVADLLAVLDRFAISRGVVAGHSLGAYVVARLAADHPERVDAAILVDGGLSLPGAVDVDPQTFIDGFLGPAIARLRLRFPSHEAYYAWWREHPSFQGSEITDEVLHTYADHDLVGEPPELRSSVLELAVRADAEEVFEIGKAARRMAVPATLLAAPRGLLNDENPMQPWGLVDGWAAEHPELRQALLVPDTNHYTILLGGSGASTVADAIAARLSAA